VKHPGIDGRRGAQRIEDRHSHATIVSISRAFRHAQKHQRRCRWHDDAGIERLLENNFLLSHSRGN